MAVQGHASHIDGDLRHYFWTVGSTSDGISFSSNEMSTLEQLSCFAMSLLTHSNHVLSVVFLTYSSSHHTSNTKYCWGIIPLLFSSPFAREFSHILESVCLNMYTSGFPHARYLYTTRITPTIMEKSSKNLVSWRQPWPWPITTKSSQSHSEGIQYQPWPSATIPRSQSMSFWGSYIGGNSLLHCSQHSKSRLRKLFMVSVGPRGSYPCS